VLTVAVSAAARVAAQRWLHPLPHADGALLVVPRGSLADLLRAALAWVAPALAAAER
jgi:hypothetical protein